MLLEGRKNARRKEGWKEGDYVLLEARKKERGWWLLEARKEGRMEG